MITLNTFSKPEEANLLRCRLEAAGIPAFLRDEFTVQMNWMFSNALGGVRVEVPEAYADSAREIISLPPVEGPDSIPVCCPQCGSENVMKREWPQRLAYLTVLTTFLIGLFPVLVSRKNLKCGACHHLWR